MKSIKLAGFSLLLLLSTSCMLDGKRVKGSGNVTTETRSVNDASRIDVLGSMDVVLATGETSVKVEGDDNLLKYIVVESSDGWLKIRTEDNINIDTRNDLVVYITTPTLTDVKLTGSGDVTADTKFTSDKEMHFRLIGSGDLSIPVNAPSVQVSVAGSGDCNVSGETRDVKVSIAGSGNFNGKELKAENADMSIAGSGSAYIFSDVKLKAKIMGSGDVRYTGNPSIEKNIMGSGIVAKAE